jgi:osmotically inducible lipoprotein OsmB
MRVPGKAECGLLVGGREYLDYWRLLMRYLKAILVATSLATAVCGCSSWDSMGTRTKDTIIGAGAGAAGGAILSGGSAAGTAAGAAIGGAAGNVYGKHQKEK